MNTLYETPQIEEIEILYEQAVLSGSSNIEDPEDGGNI